jgi:hypothetical protein
MPVQIDPRTGEVVAQVRTGANASGRPSGGYYAQGQSNLPGGGQISSVTTAEPNNVRIDPATGEVMGPAGATGPLPGVPGAPVPVGLKPFAPDGRNAFQRGVDDLTRIEPANTRPGIGGHILTAAGNVGGGVLSPLGVIAHPLQTAKSLVNTGVQAVEGPGSTTRVFSDTPSMQEGLAQGLMENPSGTIENLAGGALGGEALGGAVRPVFDAAGRGMKVLAPKVANFGLGALPDAYGGDPGAAVAREGISAFTPQAMLAQTKAVIPAVNAEHVASLRAPVLRGVPPPPVDIGGAVTSPFDAIRAAKTDPLTGVAAPAQLKKLNSAQMLLLHEPDALTGQPTTALRPLNQYSPLDANTLKSNIYGMTDYDSPFKSSLANDALKQAAHGIKGQIEAAVPDSIESGDRLHNLMTLKDLLERKGITGIPASKNALIENALRKLGTSGGGTLFRLGDALPSAATISPALGALGAAVPLKRFSQ